MARASAYEVSTRPKAPSIAVTMTATFIDAAPRPPMIFAFVAGRPVTCAPMSSDQYGRTVSTCAVGGVDLGEWLIGQGLALELAALFP